MVYVSDDDSKPERWRKAVEQDQLIGDGFHHVLRGYKVIDPAKTQQTRPTTSPTNMLSISCLPST